MKVYRSRIDEDGVRHITVNGEPLEMSTVLNEELPDLRYQSSWPITSPKWLPCGFSGVTTKSLPHDSHCWVMIGPLQVGTSNLY
jgi:hypothetical protein